MRKAKSAFLIYYTVCIKFRRHRIPYVGFTILSYIRKQQVTVAQRIAVNVNRFLLTYGYSLCIIFFKKVLVISFICIIFAMSSLDEHHK